MHKELEIKFCLQSFCVVKNSKFCTGTTTTTTTTTMKSSCSSQPLLKYFQECDREKEAKQSFKTFKDRYKDKGVKFGDMAEEISHLKIKRTEPMNRCAEISWGKHGLWTSEQKARAAKLEKQLKARWALEELIEEQLNTFQAHYNKVMVPTRLKDVVQLLMPKRAPAQELAAFTWLGDWRPSSILNLLGSLSSSLSDSNGVEQVLPQLLNEIRIEEAVIDEEMAEIQATCVLNLPFGPIRSRRNGPALESIQDEFKKIHAVLIKAQKLRLKALELVVKKVLSQTDAAEFLVAFSAIQDSIHQFTTHNKLQKSYSSQLLKSTLGSIRDGNLATNPRTKSCEGRKYSRIQQEGLSK